MAQEIANSTLLDTWGSSGNIVEPDISKIIEGWQLGEQPPHEYMNWLQNTFGSKLNHILKNGVAKWNNETEYLADSSVQHNGNIWLCKTTNTNSEPADVNANWKRIITVESLMTILGEYATKSYVDGKYSGFKNYIINGRKQVNQSELTTTDNAYNYDNHYKVGNNWFMFIDGKSIASGEPYTLSWVGSASASYYIGTAGALTIDAQTFIAIANGETITPTISSSQILWIKFASDASGSTYNKVQFELGTVVTPFEQRLYELEKNLVQSCFSGSSIYFSNDITAGNSYGGITMLPVDMRTIPILTLINQVNINGTFGTIVVNNSADYSIRGVNFYASAISTTNGAVYKAGVVADARPY